MSRYSGNGGHVLQDVWPVAEYEQMVYFFFLCLVVVQHVSFSFPGLLGLWSTAQNGRLVPEGDTVPLMYSTCLVKIAGMCSPSEVSCVAKG